MKRLLICLLLTVMIGCQAEPPDEERKLPEEEALPATAPSPGEGQTIDRKREEPVELDDNHLLTIKDPGHGRAAFSPDGKRIVSAGDDKTVRLWNAETGQQLLALKGHTTRVNGVSFSPDGKQIISGDYYNKVILWDADSGQLLRTIEGPSLEDHKYVLTTAFSADAKRVATSYQSFSTTVTIWDVPLIAAKGEQPASSESPAPAIKVTAENTVLLKGRDGVAGNMSFSPDATRVVIAEYWHYPQGLFGDRVILAKVWDCRTGKVLVDLQGHADGIQSVAFSPDGKRIVSAGDDKTVRLWNAETGQQLLALKGHTTRVNGASFSPDGKRIVSAGDDKTVRLWNVETGQQLLALKGHTHRVTGASFSPDGKQIISSDYYRIMLWSAETAQEN